jgi:ElaB/YqjD/DUF883 family membrane-anchored ribosome-binding protein
MDMNESQPGINQPLSTSVTHENVGKRISRKLNDAASSLRPSSEGQVSSRLDPVKRRVANYMDSAASYLESADIQSMKGNTSEMIRRYPVGSLALGFGVGMLLGKMVRR